MSDWFFSNVSMHVTELCIQPVYLPRCGVKIYVTNWGNLLHFAKDVAVRGATVVLASLVLIFKFNLTNLSLQLR